jgi:RNA polymerase sigma factor (sigma-70 family)
MHEKVNGEISRLLNCGIIGETTDLQLLHRFVAAEKEGAELAFEAIVKRHGPMVMGVCQSVLRDAHAADDAFQATFLVLLRKARTLERDGSLGGWLHAVALRSAWKARAEAKRRRTCELISADHTLADTSLATDSQSLDQILHEEIDRLPKAYRAPVVRFYLEGMSYGLVARLLQLSETTVRGRLARARKLLRERLGRRDSVLPAPFPVPISQATLVPPRHPDEPLATTVRSVLELVSADSRRRLVGRCNSVQIAKRVLNSMFMN